MKLINSIEIVIKKSRFIGFYYAISNVDDVIPLIEKLRREYKKATHVVYAYKIQNSVKKDDDNEPSGTAANPILNVIEKRDLNDVLIVVIRYFGGVKLGAGGLIRAYGKCASIATKKE